MNTVNNYSNSVNSQATRTVQAKIWQIVGLVLIGSGLLVMGWAGWMYVQQQAELYNPPAPIVDSSTIDPLEPLPPAQFQPAEPPAIAQNNATGSQFIKNRPVIENTPTPTPSPETIPVVVEVENTPTAETMVVGAAPTDVIQADPSNEAAITPLEVSVDDMPSLADNPLPVVEDVAEPETGPASEPLQNAATSPPTRIVAPSINLDAPVVETGWVQVEQNGVATNVWVVPDYAAGWHDNSALPGQGGNIVLSGHHNIKGEVFREIVNLEVGDTVSLIVNNQQYDYVVRDKFIVKDKGEPDSVRRANARWIGPFNEERLTLVTCWPYNNNTHRVIVIAKPLEAIQ